MTAPDPGLCGHCLHARHQPNARGSAFLRCSLANDDPAYLRYPPLPVTACPGFDAAVPDPGGADTMPAGEPLRHDD